MGYNGFGGGFGGGFGNMQQMLKQAQNLQKQIEEAQEKLKNETISATSGGGMVEVVVNGEGTLQSIKINPAVVDPDDVETLEDLIVSALSSATEQAAALKEKLLGPYANAGGLF